MRSVVVDANVFVSFLVERNEAQHSAGRALLYRYDAVATFDRKLANRLETFGLAAYW